MIILVVFPIYSYIFINRFYNKLDEKEFHIKFSTLYTDMKFKPTAKDTIILLCSRRLLIVMVTVFLNDHHLPLVFSYIYPSILLLSYYIINQPFDSRYAYWLELLNESHVITSAYFTFFYTEWTTNIEARYNFSAFYLDLTIWVIILNQVFIFYEIYISLRKNYLKRRFHSLWRIHLR